MQLTAYCHSVAIHGLRRFVPTPKLLRIMKIIAFLLTVASLQLAARSAGQSVTIHMKDVPIQKVIREVSRQTGISIVYAESMFRNMKPVSIHVEDASPLEALETCLKGQPFSVEWKGQTILITPANKKAIGIVQTLELPTIPSLNISGRVVDEEGRPVVATVAVKGTNQGTTTDEQGRFELSSVDEKAILLITGIGIEPREVNVNGKSDMGFLVVKRKVQESEEVMVSTGYQRIPKERAAGSFAIVNQELLEKRVSLNVLQRLEDYVPGLIFQRDQNLSPRAEGSNITIRGVSTILSENQPLIVVDNFPYEGDIKNINPNDVKSITILRDASAASIWGARAGNGVIVIETKQGSFNSQLQVSANSLISIGAKPDAFFEPQMSPAEYVDVAEMLFEDYGYFQYPTIRYNTFIPPHIQTLLDRRDGRITPEEARTQLDEYKQGDVRRDIDKYFYRKSINRQFSINMRGGGKNQHFAFNAGYDDNSSFYVGDSYNRLTLDLRNTWKFFKDKLTVNGGIHFVRSNNRQGSLRHTSWENQNMYMPYTRFVDDNGNHIPLQSFNKDAIADAMANGLLDWNFYPVKEIGLSPEIGKLTDYRLNANISYAITRDLVADIQYQYWGSNNDVQQIQSVNSYRVRNDINNITQAAPDGSLSYPIPVGDILQWNNANSYAHNLRGQLQYNKNWGIKHSLTALAGAEMRDRQAIARTGRYYGYNDELGISVPVDHVNLYRHYLSGLVNQRITDYSSHNGTINRFQSYYANASYTFDNRISFTASARRDASNLFGVEANNRVSPLWSVGASWDISREKFYRSELLPYLKLRGTFGYNGNVNNSLAALLTARYQSANFNINNGINEPYVTITNPPNPLLRWEKVAIMNLGIDFAMRNRRFQGTIEMYQKRGIDLIGAEIFPPSSGVASFRGNYANTRTTGVDMDLHSINVDGAFKWGTDLNISFVRDRVTRYGLPQTATQVRNYGRGFRIFEPFPVVGRPLFSLFSYHWQGLDPENGDPLGLLNGEVSSDYAQIMAGYSKVENMVYHGPGRPPVFGALRNTFSYKGFSLSANISFRLGYYFRRTGVFYTSLTSTTAFGTVVDDFSRRWQTPGDEATTQIPSFRPELTATINSNRTLFYNFSEALVERGDNIRLQDVMLSYSLTQKSWLPVREAQLYVHGNNLGIIWKASKLVKDPDYRTFFPPQRTISVGLRVNFN